MDDITGKIGQLLSDPQAMEQIMSLKSLLSPDTEQEAPSTMPKPPPPKPQNKQLSLPQAFSDDTMKTIMKVMPLLNDIRKEDDTTRLLNALRPFLSSERRAKLDEATKILQIMKILPVIKRLNL